MDREILNNDKALKSLLQKVEKKRREQAIEAHLISCPYNKAGNCIAYQDTAPCSNKKSRCSYMLSFINRLK